MRVNFFRIFSDDSTLKIKFNNTSIFKSQEGEVSSVTSGTTSDLTSFAFKLTSILKMKLPKLTLERAPFSLDQMRGLDNLEWQVMTLGQSLSLISAKEKSRVLPMSSPNSLIFFLFKF